MNCFNHPGVAAVGLCSICQKAICRQCVGRDSPRLLCETCLARGTLYGYEYVSGASIGGLPLIHACTGLDPATMRPKVARGVIAIGNIAVGVLAIGGLTCGLVAIGGASIGVLLAFGGVAIGAGLSIGGVAIGSIAIGGAAIGFKYAIGGGSIAPAVIDGRRCDEAARLLWSRWLGTSTLPPSCR